MTLTDLDYTLNALYRTADELTGEEVPPGTRVQALKYKFAVTFTPALVNISVASGNL